MARRLRGTAAIALSAITLLGLSALPAGAQVAERSTNARAAATAECVIIDNDFDIDDLMAIPLVVGNKRVAAVVQSEGYTVPEQAAPVADRLVNGAKPGASSIPVIVGGRQEVSPDISKWPWMSFFRTMLNRGNGLLSAPPEPWPTDPQYARKVARAVQSCSSVSILILGTYTSFTAYLPLIKAKVDRVVIMGQPMGDESRTPGRESFNCSFDLSACEQAMTDLADLNAYFVDVPRFPECRDSTNPPAKCYTPNFQMVAAVSKKGLAGRLRQALINDIACSQFYTTPETQGRGCSSLSTWEPAAVTLGPGGEMLLWDQTAALFLVRPQVFSLYYPPDAPEVGGKHYEPTLVNDSDAETVDRLRALWTRYTNRAR